MLSSVLCPFAAICSYQCCSLMCNTAFTVSTLLLLFQHGNIDVESSFKSAPTFKSASALPMWLSEGSNARAGRLFLLKKIRFSNMKLEYLSQILRGGSCGDPDFEAIQNDVDHPLHDSWMAWSPMLNEFEEHWNCNLSVSESELEPVGKKIRPRLRSDWRGDPVRLAKGFKFITRAGAADRYNHWLQTDEPHFRWSRFRVNNIGEVREIDNTPKVDEEYYGIGGEPGWLGWGAIPQESLLKWVHEGNEDVLDALRSASDSRRKPSAYAPYCPSPCGGR